jgi:hypothetical protein
LVLGGCAFKEKLLLGETQDLMIRGDYSRALEKNRQILERYPRMGDRSLFQMGLISAHPKNPGKDYKKSLRYFQRLIEEFPKSDLKNQAQIWVLSLQEVIEKDKKIDNLQRQIEKLKEIDLGIQEKKEKSLP